MATIRKHGVGYEARIRRRGYPQLTRHFKTRREAEAWARDIESAMDHGTWCDMRRAQRTTLREALEWYLEKIVPTLRGSGPAASVVRHWLKQPMAQYVLTAVSPTMLAEYTEHQLKQRAPQTVKHRLALLRRVFNVLRKSWGFTDLRNPVESVEMPKVSNERQRRVETLPDGTSELDLVLKQSDSVELPAFARLAVETAARRTELALLLWADVDLEGRTAKLRKTKNGDPIREIPLSPQAVDLLRQIPRSGERVFSYRPDAYTRAWTRARHRAAKQFPGVATLNLHDGRHEGTSQLFEDGLSTMEVASVTGHKDLRMLRRYTHMQAKRLAAKIAQARTLDTTAATNTAVPHQATVADRQ